MNSGDLVSSGQTATKRLSNAFRRVSDAWFPANPDLLEEIQTAIKQDEYKSSLDGLLEAVRRDPSLYTRCLQSLFNAQSGNETGTAGGLDPAQVLENADFGQLSQIVLDLDASTERRRFSTATAAQLQQLKKVLISATSAEMLAESSAVSRDNAFSCAIFRQLGLTLIAWNFPNVFERCLKTQSPDESVDKRLGAVLGFTPMLLGVRIARDWKLLPEIKAALGDAEPGTLTSSERFLSETLSQLCEIGEALAKASDPEHYPEAQRDWALAKEEIIQRLGSEGLENLRGRIKSNLAGLEPLLKTVVRETDGFDKRFDIMSEAARSPSGAYSKSVNRYLQHCSPAVQHQLEEFYAKLEPETVSRDAISYMVKFLLPSAGFARGCIYLINPENMNLEPRLAIGQAKLAEFEVLHSSAVASALHPVAIGYRSRSAAMEHNAEFEGHTRSYIAGPIGTFQRVGVLYAELDPLLCKQSETALLHFKAFAVALSDALRLF